MSKKRCFFLGLKDISLSNNNNSLTIFIFYNLKQHMSKIIKTVKTVLGPKAVGPYSSARIYNGIMYVSGNIGIDPKTNQLISDEV